MHSIHSIYAIYAIGSIYAVGRYTRSKLGTTRVLNTAVLRGTDRRRTGMRTK